MRAVSFVSGEYYHIYNRGVEKRKVFLDNADYFRFLLSMKEFNDINPIFNLVRLFKQHGMQVPQKAKQPVVEFLCYSLLPNHYHFLVRQLEDGGISKFMQKLGCGYTNYFNIRYQRSGVLFQGVFKVKHIENDEYLLHLSRYIHLNALDIIQSGWRKAGMTNRDTAYQFLKNYKWHSLPFIIDKNKSCLIDLHPEVVLGQFRAIGDYEEFIKQWMVGDFRKISNLAME